MKTISKRSNYHSALLQRTFKCKKNTHTKGLPGCCILKSIIAFPLEDTSQDLLPTEDPVDETPSPTQPWLQLKGKMSAMPTRFGSLLSFSNPGASNKIFQV